MSAVDIVAVKQQDGTIKSTGFHVLFNSKRSSELVQIEVNGKLIESLTMVAHHSSGQVVFSPELSTKRPHKIVRDEKTKQLSMVLLPETTPETAAEKKAVEKVVEKVKQNKIQRNHSYVDLAEFKDDHLPKCVNNVQKSEVKIKKSGSFNSIFNAMKSRKKPDTPSPLVPRKSDSSSDIQGNDIIELNKAPTSFQLQQMELKDGINEIRFKSTVSKQTAFARIYLWSYDAKIVISDVDGTITKSDIRGLFYHKLGYDWVHDKVVELYKTLCANGYQIVYLTARSARTTSATRSFLDKISIPHGPIFTAPHSYLGCVTTELWKQTAQVKLAHLHSLRKLFPESENPFVAGFGNQPHDAHCYNELKIDQDRIYIVNRSSEVTVNSNKTKYCEIAKLCASMFPPLQTSKVEEDDIISPPVQPLVLVD